MPPEPSASYTHLQDAHATRPSACEVSLVQEEHAGAAVHPAAGVRQLRHQGTRGRVVRLPVFGEKRARVTWVVCVDTSALCFIKHL